MKSRFKLHLGLMIFVMLTNSVTFAATPEGVVETQGTQLVEVEINQDNLAPYKYRRESYSINFSLNYEALELKNYLSVLDNAAYSSVYGASAVPMITVGLAYQYNINLGSLALGVIYGKGSLSGELAGASRTLDIDRYGLTARFTADMIMDEPYVAPYGEFKMWQMGVSEKSPTDKFSATTQWGYAYTLGILTQLNWIDRSTATQTTFNWGLENTYLDLFLTKYSKTNAEDDPNTETDFLYGAGIHLEF